jgi:prepilin-type N-terminal cleavage/methylation domain-containing protein
MGTDMKLSRCAKITSHQISSPRGRQRGFTLVEVLAAVVILMVVTWAGAQGIKASITSSRQSMDRLYATNFARAWLEYYRYYPVPATLPNTGSDPNKWHHDTYRNVFYSVKVMKVSVIPASPTSPRLTVTVSAYRPRTAEWASIDDFAQGPTVTVYSHYYSSALGK